MGLFDKLKMTKQAEDEVVPPPPPAPPRAPNTVQPQTLPPLPESPLAEADVPPAEPPFDDGAGELPDVEEEVVPLDEANDGEMQDLPRADDLPNTEDGDDFSALPDEEMGEMHKVFSDIPPIKVTEEMGVKGILTDDHVQDLDVDQFVLPGEETAEPPAAAAPSASAGGPDVPLQQAMKRAFSGPMYIDVQSYEEVQTTIDDLTGQLKQVATDVDSITKINDKEDKEFSKIVAKLEKIQDKIMQIDEHLFDSK